MIVYYIGTLLLTLLLLVLLLTNVNVNVNVNHDNNSKSMRISRAPPASPAESSAFVYLGILSNISTIYRIFNNLI